MGCLVSAATIWFLGYGLWEHDWRIIFVSALLACIWPLIKDEVLYVAEEHRRHELLDLLWADDDDDLSNSA